MLNIAIWDDNKSIALRLKSLIEDIAEENDYEINVVEATDDSELIKSLLNSKKINTLFLDIETDEDSKYGLKLAKELRETNPNFYLVFQTGHSAYTFDSFECKTFDYILKPVEPLKLENVLTRMIQDLELQKKLRTKSKLVSFPNNITINYDNIYYIEKAGHKDKIYTKDSFYYTYGTFKSILKLLPNTFVQSHKSYIVNMEKIVCINSHEDRISLADGLTCPVSVTHINNIKTMGGAYSD